MMHLTIRQSVLALPAFLIALLFFSSVSRAQQPGDAQHSIIQKIAYEAKWYLGSSSGGGGSLVEGNENQAGQRTKSNLYVRDPLESKPRWIDEGEFPAWSPDGSRLAYCTTIGPNFGQIRIVNADGKGKRLATHLKDGACFPDWSPDGKEIAITLFEAASTSLAIVDENGTLVRNLGPGSEAHWSPDGKQILFLRPRPMTKTGGSIWIMRADGSGAKEVLEDSSLVVQANWLPSGAGILFVSERDGLAAIYSADLDGKNVRRIAADSSVSLIRPAESPDGSSLVVEADSPPDSPSKRISVVQIDTHTHATKLLVGTGDHCSVFWGHVGEANAKASEKKTPPTP
jgi:Tol biopolymer transport system component